MDKSEQLALQTREITVAEKVIGLILFIGLLFLIYYGVGWMLSKVTSPMPVDAVAESISTIAEPTNLSLVATEISSLLNH